MVNPMTCNITINCSGSKVNLVRKNSNSNSNSKPRKYSGGSPSYLSVYLTKEQRDWVEHEAQRQQVLTGQFIAMSTVVHELVESARAAAACAKAERIRATASNQAVNQPYQGDLFDFHVAS